MAAELEFGQDVALPPQGPAEVLHLHVPDGLCVVYATASIVNRGDTRHVVAVWLTSLPPPMGRFIGPRSGQATVEPGASASVAIGPLLADIGRPEGVDATLVAQRDGGDGDVWVTEGTDFLNRAGATGMVVILGVGPPTVGPT